jgi:hypothetical protein
MNGSVMSWKSSKQDTVAASTREVGYIAASKAAKKVVWIRNFLMALGMIQGASYLLNMYCDNNDAIVQANDSRQHKKNKYILMRYHLIR